jgi:AcrR family transcriptional regulator
MRKLGQELGVEAMSLYNHVANKDDLLDGMIDIVFSEIEPPTTDVDWKTAMRQRVLSAREIFLRHPWAAHVLGKKGGIMDAADETDIVANPNLARDLITDPALNVNNPNNPTATALPPAALATIAVERLFDGVTMLLFVGGAATVIGLNAELRHVALVAAATATP